MVQGIEYIYFVMKLDLVWVAEYFFNYISLFDWE